MTVATTSTQGATVTTQMRINGQRRLRRGRNRPPRCVPISDYLKVAGKASPVTFAQLRSVVKQSAIRADGLSLPLRASAHPFVIY
jgi:hypothetical protein